MTGVIEGVFLAGGALKLIERFQGSEELRLEQQACVRDLFAKHFSKDFDNECLDAQSARVTLRPGANQYISAAFHNIDQHLQQKHQRLLDLFQKGSTIGVREAIALYLKKWLASISAEEGSLDAKEVTRHLDFTRQILMRADLFRSTGTNSFLRSLAFTCEQLEQMADQLYSENRTASRVLDKICHAGRETVHLMIPIFLFAIVVVIPGKIKQTHFDAITLLRSRGEDAREASEDFREFWATPVGEAIFAILNSPHCIDLLGLRTMPVGTYKLTADMVRPHVVGFSAEVVEQYLQLFKQLDSFIYFMRVLQLYQNLAAASGDVLMCYLYATLNHLLHEIEVALVALHQVSAKLLGAGKTRLQTLLKQAKSLTSEQLTWICRLRYINEESLGANHHCLFNLFCEMRQLSALDRLPSIQRTIARNVRSLRDAFHSNEFQSRATLPLEGTAMLVLQNVLDRVAAVEDQGAEPPLPLDAKDEDECSYDDNFYAYPEINSYGVLDSPEDETRTLRLETEASGDVADNLKWIQRALTVDATPDPELPEPVTPSAPPNDATPSSSSTTKPVSCATGTFFPAIVTKAVIGQFVGMASAASIKAILPKSYRVEPFVEERAFYDALWSLMAPMDRSLKRWDVARLVGGSMDLAVAERTIIKSYPASLPSNLQDWTFAHLTILLRALGYIQQNEVVALDKPPPVLAKVEGFSWDAERGRLRTEWPDVSHS